MAAFKSKHNMAWHIVIIDDVVVAAGNDLVTMMSRQQVECKERPGYSSCKMVTFYAKTKKAAVDMCMEDMYVRNISKSLLKEFALK